MMFERLFAKTTLTKSQLIVYLICLLLSGFILIQSHPFVQIGFCFLMILSLLWSVLVEPRLFVIRRHTAQVSSLSTEITIAILGDLHIGSPYISLSTAKRRLEEVLVHQPDVLVLVGDYVVQGVLCGKPVPIEDIAMMLDAIDIPCVAIIGNHDNREGHQRVHQAFEQTKIMLLDNTSQTMTFGQQKITFVGLADESTDEPKPTEAYPSTKPNHPLIALAHDPATWLREMPYPADVCLSGHTHAGQIRFPVFGALILPGKSPLKWSYGWSKTNAGPLYVTSGLGTSIAPIRFNAPPEGVLLTLKPQS